MPNSPKSAQTAREFECDNIRTPRGLDLGGMRRPQPNLSPEEVTKLVASLQDAGTFEYLNRAT